MKNRSAWIFCIGVFGFLGAQCGLEDSLSKDVSIDATPSDPIVIHSDLTLNPGTNIERVIAGPWFKVGFTIKNKTDRTAYVVTNLVKLSTINNGSKVETEIGIDPSVTCADVDGYGRPYIVVLGAGDTYIGLDNDLDDNGSVDPEFLSDDGIPQFCDATEYDTTNREYWYMEGLPASTTDVYSGEMEIEGWFVDSNDVPIERLQSYGFFSTH